MLPLAFCTYCLQNYFLAFPGQLTLGALFDNLKFLHQTWLWNFYHPISFTRFSCILFTLEGWFIFAKSYSVVLFSTFQSLRQLPSAKCYGAHIWSQVISSYSKYTFLPLDGGTAPITTLMPLKFMSLNVWGLNSPYKCTVLYKTALEMWCYVMFCVPRRLILLALKLQISTWVYSKWHY